MDTTTLKRLFPNASKSTLLRNAGGVAPVQGAQRKPDSPQALDRGCSARQEGKSRMVVGIVGFSRRILDSDNFIGGCKPLRDSIAASLGIDDGSECIVWEYSQVITRGPEGTIVVISVI